MQTYFRHAAVALVLLAGTGAASAQMSITRNAVDTTAIEPLQQVRAQRTVSYRAGRGRALYKFVPMRIR